MKKILILVLFLMSISTLKSQTKDSLYCFTKEEVIKIGSKINELNQTNQEQTYQIATYEDIVLRDTAIINQYERNNFILRNLAEENTKYISKLKKQRYTTLGIGTIVGIVLTLLVR